MFCILNGLFILTVIFVCLFSYFIFLLFSLQTREMVFGESDKEVETLEKKQHHDALQLSDFLMENRYLRTNQAVLVMVKTDAGSRHLLV